MASATIRWFHSPSENIECQVTAADPAIGTAAYCQTGTPALHVVMHPNGRLDLCHGVQCLGNGPVNATTLAYGKSVVVGPFRCTSLRIGMRCVVRSTAHGFLLSRAGLQRI